MVKKGAEILQNIQNIGENVSVNPKLGQLLIEF